MFSVLNKRGHWRVPQRCVLCHDLAQTMYLCVQCRLLIEQIKINSDVCPLCAKPSINNAVCGECQRQERNFDGLWASYRLQWPIHQLVTEFKFQRQLHWAPILGEWMRLSPPPWLPQSIFDAVVAMPLSRERLLERGYNQSQLLMQGVISSVHCSVSALPPLVISRQAGVPQSSLGHQERIQNVRGIFQLQMNVNKRNVLLIDDVVTTTATLNELSRTLKTAGAEQVWCWTFTRA